MTARRFIGNDLQRLFARVHREIGEDAVILSTRSLMREGSDPLIELLAAPGVPGDGNDLPFELQQAMVNSVLAHVNPSLTIGDLEDIIARDELDILNAPVPQYQPPAPEPVAPAATADSERHAAQGAPGRPLFRSAYAPEPSSPIREVLLEAGFTGLAAEAIAEAHPSETDPEMALALSIQDLPVAYPDEGMTALISIQGPAGAGSTTALLRMALDCADAGRETRLIAADASQAGRREQLHAYGSAMGIDVADAFDAGSLLRQVGRAPRGACLFVDAGEVPWSPPAGLSSRHYAYLALPAHWNPRILHRDLAGIPLREFSGVVPTFVDLATDLSPVLSLAIETRLGLAFLSSGRDISTGITVADPFTLASGVFTTPTGDRTDGRLAAAG